MVLVDVAGTGGVSGFGGSKPSPARETKKTDAGNASLIPAYDLHLSLQWIV